MPRWTALVGAGLRLRVARRIRRLADTAYWTLNTGAIQRAQLRRLLARAKDTEFGRAHGFARLAHLDDRQIVSAYRAAVPLADYAAFRPFIDRMRDGGEPDVLWPGRVMDFAQTSGTTAGDKYIPVSRQMLRSNFLASLDIFAAADRFGVSLPWVTSGRVLFLGGSTDLKVNQHGIRTGDLSGIVAPLLRWPASAVYLPGRDIALMAHWPSKIDAMAQRCIDQDVRMVCGMCSWALVLFERVLALARQRDRAGAAIRDIWPNFRLFVHGGVKYAPFDQRIRQVYSGAPDGPDIPCRLELYPASEGFIAIQDTPRDPGLRLLSDIGIFYEFVPLEQIDRPDAAAYTCDTVEPGRRYVVVMSTCAGLWRYIIGDVVEFDTIPAGPDGAARPGAGPCRLRIVGRHRHFINAFGENLIVEHVENAVAAAAAQTGLVVGEFSAAPVYPGDGRRAGLELVVEIDARAVGGESAPTPRAIAAFAAAFDESLQAQNADYTTKRTGDLGMAPPTISIAPLGTFHRWMEAQGKLGGQHKCPRCANHRDIVDSVLATGQSPERRRELSPVPPPGA